MGIITLSPEKIYLSIFLEPKNNILQETQISHYPVHYILGFARKLCLSKNYFLEEAASERVQVMDRGL